MIIFGFSETLLLYRAMLIHFDILTYAYVYFVLFLNETYVRTIRESEV